MYSFSTLPLKSVHVQVLQYGWRLYTIIVHSMHPFAMKTVAIFLVHSYRFHVHQMVTGNCCQAVQTLYMYHNHDCACMLIDFVRTHLCTMLGDSQDLVPSVCPQTLHGVSIRIYTVGAHPKQPGSMTASTSYQLTKISGPKCLTF